jgi:hypothetical protein
VDDVTMSLLNKPAAELYSTTTRMKLESTTMRPEGLRYIRTTNTALMNAKSRAIAIKAASLPSGTGGDSKFKTGDTTSRRQRMAEERKQAEEKRRSEDAKKKTDATKNTDTAKKTPRENPPRSR